MKNILTLVLLGTLTLSAQDIYATFDVKPSKEATLSFTIGGTVTSANAEIGSKVNKGDLLATLDSDEQIAMLKLAQDDATNAQTNAIQSLNSYERHKKLKDIMDEEQFEKISFAAKIAEINAAKAQSTVELRQAQLNKTKLVAPFSGVITAKYKEVGDAVSGAQPQAFYQIMNISSVKLIIEFDEKYAKSVKTGSEFVYSIDDTKNKYTGKISKIYPTIDPKTRKISAEIITENLMPGLFGHGVIKAE